MNLRQEVGGVKLKWRKLNSTADIKAIPFKDFSEVVVFIESDKDDIKSWITEKHHFYCYERKWIDDYSMDCIEKRYGHYKDEGGNSFIEELMNELRSLPKTPPQQ